MRKRCLRDGNSLVYLNTRFSPSVAYFGGAIRATDLFARWGGEEFIVLMPGSDINAARLLAEKLRMLLEKQPFADVGQVTCSFGVAQLMYDETAERFCLRADEAMCAAKLSGRNNVNAAGAIGRRDKDSCASGAQV